MVEARPEIVHLIVESLQFDSVVDREAKTEDSKAQTECKQKLMLLTMMWMSKLIIKLATRPFTLCPFLYPE